MSMTTRQRERSIVVAIVAVLVGSLLVTADTLAPVLVGYALWLLAVGIVVWLHLDEP